MFRIEDNKNNSIGKLPLGWLSAKDVCAYTGLGYSTLNRSINKGKIRVSKITGKNLFRKKWIDNFLEGTS